jgi:flagellin-like protein
MIPKKEEAVSPVIGVMLMIVVTVIVAAAVSAFAGGYVNDDKKAPVAAISCTATDGGLLFTHESGDYIDLADVIVVLRNGEETKRFIGSENQHSGDEPIIRKVSAGMTSANPHGYVARTADLQINTGNQFYLYADNDGNSVSGGYLGWDATSDDPAFYLTIDEIGTYRIVDRESGQTISEGEISV